jgi:glycosyltransferase involved in cell wall biosynthesis
LTAKELHKRDGIDIILTRSPSDVSHLVGYRISKKEKIKWIANWNDPVNGIWPAPYQKYNSIFFSFYFSFVFKTLLRSSDINSFPSAALLEHFNEELGINRVKAIVIPHIRLPGLAFSEIVTKNNQFELCHAGNLSKERSPEHLFQALCKIKENFPSVPITFTILGVISDNVRELIHKYHLEETIQYLQPIGYYKTLQYLNKCDLLVLIEANLENGIFLPSKLSDYAQVNVPILALSPSRGEVATLFSNNGGGVCVENTHWEGIYNVLSEFLKAHIDGTPLTPAFSNKKMNEYHSVKKIIKLYKEIITGLESHDMHTLPVNRRD